MEEGCLMSLIFKKEKKEIPKEQGGRLSQGFNFPVYIITESVNSEHLRPLQMLFQKENIALSFQKELTFLRKIPNTYQNRYFIILNDFTNPPALVGQFKNISYECSSYPQTERKVLLARYKKFVSKELGCDILQLKAVSDFKSDDSNQQNQNSEEGKGKIKLKSVSKIFHNYKSVWPKKLFIYGNRRDDQYFKEYVSKIRQMRFSDAVFIDQIEEYVRFIPQKGDISFCILMSEYSAINLRKFFKQSDQIILLGNDRDQCLPLLRGKVTFFTTDYQCMDALLKKTFGMSAKLLYSSQLKLQQDRTNDIKPDLLMSTAPNNRTLEGTSTKWSDLKTSSVFNFTITKQFQLTNENSKELILQSNVLNFNIAPTGRVETGFENNNQHEVVNTPRLGTPSKDKPDFKRKKQQILFQFTKISPLRVVHMETVSIANTSIRQSEVSSHGFQDLFNKIDFSQLRFNSPIKSQPEIPQTKAPDIRQSSKQNISDINENNSLSSRYSSASSHNSRIINRMNHCKKQPRPANTRC